MTSVSKTFDLTDSPTNIATVIDEFYPIPSTATTQFVGFQVGTTGVIVMIPPT